MVRPASGPLHALRRRSARAGALSLALVALADTGALLSPMPSGQAMAPRARLEAPGAPAAGRTVAPAGAAPAAARDTVAVANAAAPMDAPHAPGGDEFLSGFAEAGNAASRDARAPAAPIDRQARVPAEPRALPPSAGAPAPLLTLRLDRARLRAGETAWLNLGSSGATRCIGVQGVSGTLPLLGRVAVVGLDAGRHALRVACHGPGGSTEAQVLAVVPLPVSGDSRDNRRLADQDPAWQRHAASVLHAAPTLAPAELAGADFLQEGRLALFAARPDATGRRLAHFEAVDDQGRWTDRSADLLPDAQDRVLCDGPAQALVTDLNGDARPDVYLACAQGPQWLLLSSADGRYQRVATPFALAALQAEARDADGDGIVDIVTTVASTGGPSTLLLAGRGDGRLVPVSAPQPAQRR